MIQTNKMSNVDYNENNKDKNKNNRSNARFRQSMLVSGKFWRAYFVHDESERREEKTTRRVVVQEEKQAVYWRSLTSKDNIEGQVRVKHRPNNINLKMKRHPNNNNSKRRKSSMPRFLTLSFRSQKGELSVSDPSLHVNKLHELVTVTYNHTDVRSRDITRHHHDRHHNPYQRHPPNRSHLNSDRCVLSLYTTWGAILLALLLAANSLLSLSSSLSNSINTVNGNNIQGANLMKATVVSSSSSLLSNNNNNNQQTNSMLLLTGNTKQADSPQASSREIEKQIVDKILGEGYDKRIRPAGSGPYNASRPGSDGPTIVKVNTLVRSISKIDDVTMEYSVQLSLRQEWTDDRLAFGKMSQYRNYGLNSITLTEQERLWKPDLFFRNEKEGHFHKIIMPNVLLRIKGEGQVLYSIRISLVLACPMDLKYYPLDKQNCTIEMASYGYLDEDLKFLWKENNPVQIAKPLNLPRFTLETYDTAYCTSRTTTGAYSCLRIDLIFKREFSYYLIQIYIPCCMLVIVSWVSFWLDPNAIPARVSLGVTTLLTMATQISGINASLPPVSYTKAIDVWTGVCLTFVFGALLEFALVNYASRSDQHKREMLTSALTHTQQMRWREATAAAAAAGVAPPTSPPPDENSPSMLATKQPTFFGPFLPLAAPHCAAHLTGMGGGQTTVTNGQLAQQHSHQLRSTTANSLAAAAEQLDNFKKNPRLAGTSSSINGSRGIATVDGGTTTTTATTNLTNYSTIGGTTRVHVNGNVNKKLPPGSQLNNNNGPTNNNGNNNINRGTLLNNNATTGLTNSNNVNNHPSKMTPQINCPLQYMKSPREIHLMSPKPPKRKNWCKMWLAKFPTRSKRIDVISRIFFPLKFALFNLVYWTTYLFREEDTVA